MAARLAYLLDHERVESAVVDAVRYRKQLGQGGADAAADAASVAGMAGKLRLAQSV
ncbi:hypothetical protein [Nocardia sp. CY41]|uniref:hypothetical protein n=1 Tax=Nocardia sp. CY41 TaxID=2608686 RepID=UPI00135B328B|nr:hypothetical protein [Nocardia sp. CY41]